MDTLTKLETFACTLNLGLAPAWFRGKPRGNKPPAPDLSTLSEIELAEFNAWLATNNPEIFTPVTMALGTPQVQIGNLSKMSTNVAAKIKEHSDYWRSPAYLNWRDDCFIDREMLFRIRCAQRLVALFEAGTVPASADPLGKGSNALDSISP